VLSPDEQTQYFIVALPRSGTAWLANFLTWGNSFCFHEALYGCESLERLDEIFVETGAKYAGGAETAVASLLPAVYARFPNAKYIFVLRDIEDIFASLNRLQIPHEQVQNMVLPFWWGIDNVHNALTVHFKSLFLSTTMRDIWEYIGIDQPFPFKRFELLRNMHVEDGFSSGYGRFTDPDLIRENTAIFTKLCATLKRHSYPKAEIHVA